MSDTTIKKVESESSPRGDMGQKYLVAGKRRPPATARKADKVASVS